MKSSTLTQAEVDEISALLSKPCQLCGGVPRLKALAARFNTSKSTVSRVGAGIITEGTATRPEPRWTAVVDPPPADAVP